MFQPDQDRPEDDPQVLKRQAQSATDETDETHDSLLHLGTVIAVFAVSLLVIYAVPALADFRPWIPGEPLPFASVFDPAPVASIGDGSAYRSSSAASEEQLSEELGEGVAANLGETEDAPSAAPVEVGEEVAIDATEYAELGLALADPGHRGMAPFYEQLLKTFRGEQVLTRVSHYGDSSIATDLITSTIRRRMQRRFGDGGHGFVLMAKGYLPYRHRDLTHRFSESWSLKEAVRQHDADGMYGYGGVQMMPRARAWASFGTDDDAPVGNAVSSFTLLFQRHPRGGNLWLTLDDGERVALSTRGEATEDGSHRVEVSDGEHTLEVKNGGGGRNRLYGMVMEREAGVVYDSLGLVGARASRMRNFDRDHLHRQLAMRESNLIVLGFGGNDASDRVTRESYEADFRSVIQHVREDGDGRGCLVFGPLDQAKRGDRGHIRTMPTIPAIVEAQRAAAASEGCAYFDTFNAMGGEGAMRRWHRARPRLAMGDFRHATPAGYAALGNMLYKAILKGFAEWLAAQPAETRVRVEDVAAEADASEGDASEGDALGGAPDTNAP